MVADRPYALRVNLSEKTVQKNRIPERWRRKYLGGKGIGARYLYAEVDPGTDPLDPENILAFCVGPLAGALPGTSRYAAVTKSPLTGVFLDSYGGGTFPDRLAGSLDDCLLLLVTGKSDEPVRLVIEDGMATIDSAETWGLDTAATAAAYPDAATACIGPAGENGVHYATIASDGGDHHAGRGGAGAVMGAKRLKAIVATGPPVQPPTSDLEQLCKEYTDRYVNDDIGAWQTASETLESIDFANEVNALATEGWKKSEFDSTSAIGIDAVRSASIGREYPTDSVPGGFRIKTSMGETVPRGATQMTLGAGLAIDDFDTVAVLGEACDRLGVDVISAGNAVAWAIRAAEMDVINADITFGDGDTAKALIEAIARDESGPCDHDVVAALRKGIDAASAKFDVKQLPTVKAMELPAYDPRAIEGMALAYATSDRGGCHRRARPIEKEVFEEWDRSERIGAVKTAQDIRSVLWSFVVDDFAGETLWHDCGAAFFELLNERSDVAYPADKTSLCRTGERIWTLTRLFNVREGINRTADRLPDSFLTSNGSTVASAVDPNGFEQLLDSYYRTRGWGREGRPTQTTLERLDLVDVVDEATPVGIPFDSVDSPSISE